MYVERDIGLKVDAFGKTALAALKRLLVKRKFGEEVESG